MIKTSDYALMALFMALVCVATMVIRIPIPQTNGYMNLGDSLVLLSAVTFGPSAAFITGGIGSALADLFGGYPQWAPWTLAIKGLEAVIAWWLLKAFRATDQRVTFGQVLAFILATAWMVLGYYGAECIMYDPKAALAEIPANAVQAAGSVILATILLPVMQRILSARTVRP